VTLIDAAIQDMDSLPRGCRESPPDRLALLFRRLLPALACLTGVAFVIPASATERSIDVIDQCIEDLSGSLDDRWSWTDAQIHAYEGSVEQRDLQQEVGRVRAAFVAANPGYEIWVNPQIRSLEVQLDHWNRSESIQSAGANLLDELLVNLGAAEFAQASAAETCAAIGQFIRSHVPSPSPALAAPGLSPHGQMRPVDFQVHQAGRVIAGPSTAAIWDAGGWADRVDDAVRKASRRFIGPLANPREPWHYWTVTVKTGV
jgi:hypothetical protein